MAKRKPVDMGGLDAVLPTSGVDLIASVIQSDRRRAGRGEFREDSDPQSDTNYDNMTSPMTSPIVSQPEDVQPDTPASPPASPMADLSVSPSADVQAGLSVGMSDDVPHSKSDDIYAHDASHQNEGSATSTRSAVATARKKRTPTATERARSEPPKPRTEPRNTRAGQAAQRAADRAYANIDILHQRIRRAKEMSNSRTMTVTLRLPQELNDWLDEYVHENWRDRVKKQQLVIEALQMLVARRGQAGDEVIPTELLGEGTEKDVL